MYKYNRNYCGLNVGLGEQKESVERINSRGDGARDDDHVADSGLQELTVYSPV